MRTESGKVQPQPRGIPKDNDDPFRPGLNKSPVNQVRGKLINPRLFETLLLYEMNIIVLTIIMLIMTFRRFYLLIQNMLEEKLFKDLYSDCVESLIYDRPLPPVMKHYVKIGSTITSFCYFSTGCMFGIKTTVLLMV